MSIDDRIRDAVLRFNGSILCRSDAKGFLGELAPKKDNTERLFSWLLFFRLVPSGAAAIASAVAAGCAKYRHDISQWFRDIDDPLANKPRDVGRAIARDVPQSIDWFHWLVAGRLPLPRDDVASLHASRILCALYRLDPEQYAYVQGFDRFAFVCYALALLFTGAAALPPDVAEAIAFSITAELLKLLQAGDIIAQRKMHVYKRIDEQVRRRLPEIAREIDRDGIMSFIYRFRWHMLLFADEHPFNEILNIWDAARGLTTSLSQWQSSTSLR
jgi:hypothetical protein